MQVLDYSDAVRTPPVNITPERLDAFRDSLLILFAEFRPLATVYHNETRRLERAKFWRGHALAHLSRGQVDTALRLAMGTGVPAELLVAAHILIFS